MLEQCITSRTSYGMHTCTKAHFIHMKSRERIICTGAEFCTKTLRRSGTGWRVRGARSPVRGRPEAVGSAAAASPSGRASVPAATPRFGGHGRGALGLARRFRRTLDLGPRCCSPVLRSSDRFSRSRLALRCACGPGSRGRAPGRAAVRRAGAGGTSTSLAREPWPSYKSYMQLCVRTYGFISLVRLHNPNCYNPYLPNPDPTYTLQ
jgi:hypothetical protein